jgi:DNA-binding winged helix-turn-helix (wHTH) protein
LLWLRFLPVFCRIFPELDAEALKSLDGLNEKRLQNAMMSCCLILMTSLYRTCPPRSACLTLRPREMARKGDLIRPLRWEDLRLRLTHLLSRSTDETEFAVGPYVCTPLERMLLNDEGEEAARLTEKEVTLLRTLAEAGPNGVSRAALLEKVWGYRDDLDTHTLETHIYRLRQKLETDPESPRLLLTLESGYALTSRRQPVKLNLLLLGFCVCCYRPVRASPVTAPAPSPSSTSVRVNKSAIQFRLPDGSLDPAGLWQISYLMRDVRAAEGTQMDPCPAGLS